MQPLHHLISFDLNLSLSVLFLRNLLILHKYTMISLVKFRQSMIYEKVRISRSKILLRIFLSLHFKRNSPFSIVHLLRLPHPHHLRFLLDILQIFSESISSHQVASRLDFLIILIHFFEMKKQKRLI